MDHTVSMLMCSKQSRFELLDCWKLLRTKDVIDELKLCPGDDRHVLVDQ